MQTEWNGGGAAGSARVGPGAAGEPSGATRCSQRTVDLGPRRARGQREVNKAPRTSSNVPEDVRLNGAAPPGLPNSHNRPVVHSYRDKDNRAGFAPATAEQRAAAGRTRGRVRWNALGTPQEFRLTDAGRNPSGSRSRTAKPSVEAMALRLGAARLTAHTADPTSIVVGVPRRRSHTRTVSSQPPRSQPTGH